MPTLLAGCRACSPDADAGGPMPSLLAGCGRWWPDAEPARRMPTRVARCRACSPDADAGGPMPSLLAGGDRVGSPSGKRARRTPSLLGVGAGCQPFIRAGSGRICSTGARLDGSPADPVHRRHRSRAGTTRRRPERGREARAEARALARTEGRSPAGRHRGIRAVSSVRFRGRRARSYRARGPALWHHGNGAAGGKSRSTPVDPCSSTEERAAPKRGHHPRERDSSPGRR